ncbi:MAG: type IV pilin protein [Methylococcales bacterium]|nr:type IV pilin protein [Methylococcales bacterium]
MVTHKKSSGFTLIELLIVAIIIAVLVALNSPAYQEKISKEKRPDAQAGLEGLQYAQKSFRKNCPQYATAISSTTMSCDPVKGYKLVYSALSPAGHYSLTILTPTAATAEIEAKKSYTLLAVPIKNDAYCTSFTLDQDGHKNATHEDCWLNP